MGDNWPPYIELAAASVRNVPNYSCDCCSTSMDAKIQVNIEKTQLLYLKKK